MAMGWKLLIPISLVWILIVAVMRTAHIDGILPNLIVGGILLAVVVGLIKLRRKRIDRNIPLPPPPGDGSFPVPPLPTKEPARA